MKVYLAMDIKGGRVVAGKAGRRDEYEEVHRSSRIASTSVPAKLVEEIGPRNVYIADLDRIEGKGDNSKEIEEVCRAVEEAIVDGGFRELGEVENAGYIPVFGTETFDLRKLEDGEYIVSIDIRERLLDRSGMFESVEDVVEYLNSFRIRAILVLPIHQVGTMSFDFGVVERVLGLTSHDVLTGGGMRSIEDLERAKEMGLSGAIISTALHLGNIDVEVVRRGRI
ncbi:HisA/HisF family protein [Geoglobus ahangari]